MIIPLNKNSIVAIFLAFILLLPFSTSLASTMKFTSDFPAISFGQHSDSDGKSEITFDNISNINLNVHKKDNFEGYTSVIQFHVDGGTSTTGYELYDIKVTCGGKEVKYQLLGHVNGQYIGAVPLASKVVDGSTPPEYQLTQGFDINSTSISVPLKTSSPSDTYYELWIDQSSFEASDDLSISIVKQSIAPGNLYDSQIPSTIVSLKQHNSIMQGQTTSYNDPDNLPIGSISNSNLQALIAANVEEEEKKEEKGSWIEGILADLLLGFGQVLQWIAEKAFGLDSNPNNSLSMDNLIFNKMDAVVIDTRDIFSGGIQVGPSDVRGYFSNNYPKVVSGIQNVYLGLRGIAITIYLVLLLYVGVKILLSVGTKDEPKAKKFIQYWCTGVGIMFLAPYFLSAIPVINNTLVEIISTNANKASTYSISQIADELGVSYTGEDAEIQSMKDELNKRIANLTSKLNGNTNILQIDEAEKRLEEYYSQYVDNNSNYSDEDKQIIKDKVNSLKTYVQGKALDWDDNVDKTYIEKEINDYVRDRIKNQKDRWFKTYVDNTVEPWFTNTGGNPSDHPLSSIPDSNKTKIRTLISNTVKYITENRISSTDSRYQYEKKKLITAIEEVNVSFNTYDARIKIIDSLDSFADYVSKLEGRYYSNIYNALSEYRMALIGAKIEDYQGMLDALQNDPMVVLERLAKEENRVIYAIAWIILFFQTFAVLFMYIKRIVVTMILICLFPVVMAVYVIDKMGDGKSQSLETWFKEFIANTTVQFFHAVIYVLIINLGIDLVRQDVERNWFILIICTCSLFPAERILRNILGMRSSTLGQLKLSGGAIVGAGLAAYSVARNGGHMLGNTARSGAESFKNVRTGMSEGKSFGSALGSEAKRKAINAGNAVRGHFVKNWQSAENEYEERKERKKNYRDSRAQNRKDLKDIRNTIKANGGIKSWKDAVNTVKAGAANISERASKLNDKVRNSKYIKKIDNLKMGRALRFAGKELKAVGGVYKKAVGVAVGASSGAEAMANSGFSAGISDSIRRGRAVGGFKNTASNKKKEPKNSEIDKFNPQYGAVPYYGTDNTSTTEQTYNDNPTNSDIIGSEDISEEARQAVQNSDDYSMADLDNQAREYTENNLDEISEESTKEAVENAESDMEDAIGTNSSDLYDDTSEAIEDNPIDQSEIDRNTQSEVKEKLDEIVNEAEGQINEAVNEEEGPIIETVNDDEDPIKEI